MTENMDHLIPPGLDDGFGDWLAGFIDGEGCFSIHRPDGQHYCCRFTVRVRFDDRAILAEVCRRTGCGTVRRTHPPSHAAWNPTALWQIDRQRECLRMVAILDRYPLRAKKARDYQVWRVALIEIIRRDQSRAAGLKRALEKVREYRDEPLGVQVSPWPPQGELTLEVGDV